MNLPSPAFRCVKGMAYIAHRKPPGLAWRWSQGDRTL